jgi:hypothetical protein
MQVVAPGLLRYLVQRLTPSFDECTYAMIHGRQLSRERLILALLICSHVAICCLSLIYVSRFHSAFHIFYDPARLPGAVVVMMAFALVSYLFISTPFSFGYFVGFYLYGSRLSLAELFLGPEL